VNSPVRKPRLSAAAVEVRVVERAEDEHHRHDHREDEEVREAVDAS
jgi:hypothetical protein